MSGKTLSVVFYRHGESAANAGQATTDPASIPLTDVGSRQAEAIARAFIQTPDLVVSSPFLRARQTAEPTSVITGVPIQIWPIEEFTYLAPQRCQGTTAAQRRSWVEAYWDASNPDAVDGDGAESFIAFTDRVRAALGRLEQLHRESASFVAVFGHGQFLQALQWLIETSLHSIDATAMRQFRTRDLARPIANGSSFTAVFDGKRWAPCENPPHARDDRPEPRSAK